MKNWLILSLFALHSLVYTVDLEAGRWFKRRRCKTTCAVTCCPAPCATSVAVPKGLTWPCEYCSSSCYFYTMSHDISTSEGGPVAGTMTADGMGCSAAAARANAYQQLLEQCQSPNCYLVGSPVCDSCMDYNGNDCCESAFPPPSEPDPVPPPSAAPPKAGGPCVQACRKVYFCKIKVCYCDGVSLEITRSATCCREAYCRAYRAARAAACHHGGIRWTAPRGCKVYQ